MSHSKERHEKNCLNCNATVAGRYCQVCGQENIEPKETFLGLITHFFNDITHFDGKFFSTVKTLVTKPGFLPKEYISGKRARYLHPIRMYVFTSAVFFIIFFSMVSKLGKSDLDIRKGVQQLAKKDKGFNLDSIRAEALRDAKTREDSIDVENSLKVLGLIPSIEIQATDSTKDNSKENTKPETEKKSSKKSKTKWRITKYDQEFKTVAEYDSAQLALPESERHGWISRRLAIRSIEIKQMYPEQDAFGEILVQKFVHSIPYLLFVSLPLYALFLKLLYIRRKQFYYVDHGLFLIFLYIFTFIHLMVLVGLDKLRQTIGTEVGIGWLQAILIFAGIYYAYKAMRVFYGQGRLKTLGKFAIFNVLTFTSLIILFVFFFFVTIFRM